MYDVCIVGAGPAGSTLARLIPNHYRVLLVDRRTLDRRWVAGDAGKPCGGLLAPRAQAELARQGLGIPSHVLGGPQLFAVRARDVESGLERLYQRFYTNVDREAFDRWLVSLVGDNVDIATGWRASSCEDDAEGATVRFHTPDGGRASIRARLVVGADGAASLVRRAAVSPLRQPQRLIAIQARFDSPREDAYYGAWFDRSLTGFYGWTIPKRDSTIVGLALPAGAGASARFEGLVAALRASGHRMGEEMDRSAAPVARPVSPLHIALGTGHVALIGEAAGLISPSSAEGISFALRSAATMAQALEAGLEGALNRYRTGAWPLAAEVCGKLTKSAGIYTPGLRRLALASGIGSLRQQVAAPGEALAGI